MKYIYTICSEVFIVVFWHVVMMCSPLVHSQVGPHTSPPLQNSRNRKYYSYCVYMCMYTYYMYMYMCSEIIIISGRIGDDDEM